MVQIRRDKVIFSRETWEELKNNPVYSELIEDIESRMELEDAIEEHKKSGEALKDFDDYDNKRMKKINRIKKEPLTKLKRPQKVRV